ncbi:diguanylate cyclase (GGDEF)-like protein/PAS domain S-box-containing protein [Oxalobacteraceae bacterium GrIS 2.11]
MTNSLYPIVSNRESDSRGPAGRLELAGIPRLLLVDDEPRLLNSLYEILSGFNYQLITASTGAETIEQLRKVHFDLVLLDLCLPDITGHDVMDFINQQGIDTTVIVLSGDRGLDAPIGALQRGAYDYLRKPYPQEALLKTVENALHRRKLIAENRDISWRLECSEKLYRYLVDSSPDIIYTVNTEGRFTFINGRAEQLLGYQPEEIIGKHYSELVHDEDLERARFVFSERRIGNRASRNIELRLKHNDSIEKARDVDFTVMSISFNSMGMYSEKKGNRHRQFLGTYGVARDITEAKRAEQLILYQAYHDILTDLPNRALFRDRLTLSLIQAKRNKTELAVMFVDLDRFKLVNDTLGHVKGDELLQMVAARLRDRLREGDTLARLGGDEFTLLLPDLHDKSDASRIAEQIVQSLSQPFALGDTQVHVSASVGISTYPGDGDTTDDLICHADIAMYKVKALGKNSYRFYESGMQDVSQQKIALEDRLRLALERGELEMYYQPQINVETGQIVGAESLIRWNHPQRGLLNAGEFMPFAEESGLIMQISDWMLDPVCRDLCEWNKVSALPLRLSLNLSPHYLDRGDFAQKLRMAIQRHGISASQLEVEITENLSIRNQQYATEQLGKLCQLGVSIAIDDFGTGYSSLAYLHRFPVHTIKIDQSFVKEIHDVEGHYPVVLAIISIARGLGLNVIAEGVETDTQASYLAQAGCNTVQGFLYHKALAQNKFLQLLTSNRNEFALK